MSCASQVVVEVEASEHNIIVNIIIIIKHQRIKLNLLRQFAL